MLSSIVFLQLFLHLEIDSGLFGQAKEEFTSIEETVILLR